MFGQQPGGGTGDFGSNNPAFGASSQNATSNMFANPQFGGNPSVPSVFESGSGQSSIFGSSTQGNPGFGGTTNSGSSGFGSTNPTFSEATSGSTGFSAGSTGFRTGGGTTLAFGSSNPAFGGLQAGAGTMFGAPVTTASSMFGAAVTTASSMFGAPSTTASSMFGAAATTASSMFGAPVITASSMFGAPSTTVSSMFGAAATTASSMFGAPLTNVSSMFGAAATTASSMFGAPVTTASSMFESSGSTFGATTPAQGSMPFGTTTGTGSIFGTTTTQPNVFGSTTTASIMTGFGATATSSNMFQPNNMSMSSSNNFGTGSAMFGNNSGFEATTTTPMFGATTTKAPMFGATTTTAPMFGATTTTAPMFGANTTTAPMFGANTTRAPMFGANTTTAPMFGATTTTAPMFGATTTTAPMFGATTTTATGMFAPTPAFGTSVSDSASLFGATTTQSGIFGATTTQSGIFAATTQSGMFGSTTTCSSAIGALTTTKPSVLGAVTMSHTTMSTSVMTSNSVFGSIASTGEHAKPTAFSAATTSVFTSGPFQATATTASSVFGGKISSTSGVPPTGNLFQSSTASGIFGSKSSETTKPTKSLFGKPVDSVRSDMDSEDNNEMMSKARVVNPFKKLVHDDDSDHSKHSPRVTGLFGKSADKDDADRDKDTQPAKVLFGKPVPATGERSERERSVSPSGSPERRRTVVAPQDKKPTRTGLFSSAISGISTDREHKTSPKDEDDELITASASKLTRRRSTLDDIQKKVAIVIKSVDPSCNNKEFLRKYFQKYGVKKVFPNPGKESATIHFATHEDADEAMRSSRYLKPGGQRLQTFWSSHTPKQEPGLLPDQSSKRSEPSYRMQERSDLDDELASMQGSSDVNQERIHFLDRPGSEQDSGRSKDQPRWKAEAKPATGSRSHNVKVKSSTSRLRLPKKEVKSTVSKPAATAMPEKGVGHISLKALTNAVGRTTAERIEILENRDKILRMARGSTKQADLATAEAIIGTCPDMCPEKERYLREDRRRLGLYEIILGTESVPGQNPKCNPMRTVKEYSRSSADQDMPLSNELRPPLVLSMTMEYLMCYIMDSGGEGKWADWYEYLWSRTRSLRKDITQQHLCDLTTVGVIEKNVRFHIYCAERLCEEDMSAFDQKINNENLTKCLQTLKEMYFDLKKNGVQCPNEDEFRAYIVLMNLNEGDTLREVQQLRMEVRESQPVKFATTVYSALSRNNYIQFFKLVRIAPFMYACVLHRYFNQVRSCALRTMLKAYRWRGESPQYPISEMVRLLGFEHDMEAATFCRHHGLSVQDDKILMYRTSFIEPETSLEERRAYTLIESKLTTSVSDTVNGGPLPQPILHEPHSSFDENGRFITTNIQISEEGKAVDDVDALEAVVPSRELPVQQTKSEAAPGESLSTTVVAQVEEEVRKEGLVQPVYSNEAIKEIAKDMFVEVINDHVASISKLMIRGINIFLGSANEFYSDMENQTVSDITREVSQEAVNEVKQEDMEAVARLKAEASARKAQIMSAMADSWIQTIVIQECQLTANQQYREVQNELLAESECRVTEKIATDILDRTIQEETCLVSESVFEIDVVERLQEIEEASKATRLLVTTRFLKKWKNRYAARQRLKRSILTFPPAPSLKSQQEQIETLIPDSRGIIHNTLHLGMGAHATLNSASQIVQDEAKLKYNTTLYKYWKQRRHEKAWAPLNIGEVLYKKLWQRFISIDKKFRGGSIYWKLVLSLPDVGPNSSMDDEFAKRTIFCCDWLRAKFAKGTVPNSPPESKTEILSLYTTRVCLQPSGQGKMSLCVRVIKGFPDEDNDDDDEDDLSGTLERGDLLGTSAVMFYVGEAGPDHGEYYVDEVRSRLQHILENLHKSSPIPLVVICPEQSPVTLDKLNLEMFVEEGMISGYQSVTVSQDIEEDECNKDLYTSILWSTSQCPMPPQLCSRTLQDLTENTLVQKYFTPVFQNLTARRQKGLLHQPPELLISYYNNLISHIGDVVSDSMLQDISWPVAEFSTEVENLPAPDWNTSDQLDFLQQTMFSLQLPEYDSPDDDDVDWTAVLDHVWAYVTAVSEDGENNVQLFSRVKWLLRRVEREFESTCHTCLRLDDCKPEYGNVPWTDLIQTCIEYRLGQANWEDLSSEDDSAELMAHYIPSRMASYKSPTEWLNAAILQVQHNVSDASQLEQTIIRSGKRKMDITISKPPSPPKLPKLDNSAAYIDLTTTSKSTLAAINSAHTWNNLLAKEKQSSEEFEAFLQKSLVDDNSFGDTFNQSFGSPEPYASAKRVSFTHLHTKSHPGSPAAALRNTFHEKSQKSLSERMSDLTSTLKSQKQADRLFELRLKSFLLD